MERVDYESMVIQDILSAYDRDELNITPWYQRRAVWTKAHKSYLINSIISTMPVPTIYGMCLPGGPPLSARFRVDRWCGRCRR